MIKDPKDPCPKCGSPHWSGPTYQSFSDRLTYRCDNCRYDIFVKPLDYKEPQYVPGDPASLEPYLFKG